MSAHVTFHGKAALVLLFAGAAFSEYGLEKIAGACLVATFGFVMALLWEGFGK